jgi:hypothetical protein
MITFDPDRLNGKMFDWRTRNADKYRQYAKLDRDASCGSAG